jgi:hypothetical protein
MTPHTPQTYRGLGFYHVATGWRPVRMHDYDSAHATDMLLGFYHVRMYGVMYRATNEAYPK